MKRDLVPRKNECSWHLHQTFELFSRTQYVTQRLCWLFSQMNFADFYLYTVSRRSNPAHTTNTPVCVKLEFSTIILFKSAPNSDGIGRITDSVRRFGKVNTTAQRETPIFLRQLAFQPQRDTRRVYFVPRVCASPRAPMPCAEKSRAIKATREREYDRAGWIVGYANQTRKAADCHPMDAHICDRNAGWITPRVRIADFSQYLTENTEN